MKSVVLLVFTLMLAAVWAQSVGLPNPNGTVSSGDTGGSVQTSSGATASGSGVTSGGSSGSSSGSSSYTWGGEVAPRPSQTNGSTSSNENNTTASLNETAGQEQTNGTLTNQTGTNQTNGEPTNPNGAGANSGTVQNEVMQPQPKAITNSVPAANPQETGNTTASGLPMEWIGGGLMGLVLIGAGVVVVGAAAYYVMSRKNKNGEKKTKSG